MAPGSLEFWFPDLDYHALCEDLLCKLVLCGLRRLSHMGHIVVLDVRSLLNFVIIMFNAVQVIGLLLQSSGDAN